MSARRRPWGRRLAVALALLACGAVASAAQSPQERLRRGMALLEEDRIEAAVRELRAAVEGSPGDPVARYQLGRALFAAGDPAAALEHLAAARERVEEPGPVDYLLGQAHLELGHLAEAREALEAARLSRPDFPPIRLYLAEVCYRAGRLAEAEERLRSLAEGYPGWSTPLVRLGSLALERGEPGAAEEHFRAAMQRETARPAAIRVRVAGALAAADDQEAALAAYRSAVEANPDFVPARVALARQLYNQRDLDAALDAYADVLELDPGHGPARLSRAEILSIQGRHREALEDVEIAILDLQADRRGGATEPEVGGPADGDAETFRARELRAELLMKLGRHEAAVREARRILAEDARRLQARFVLGTSLSRLGDAAGRDELRLYKTLNDAAEQRQLGDQYRLQADDPERSRAAYEAALAADPTDPGALLGLAALDRRAGRPEAALDALDAARAAGAGGAEWYEERILTLLELDRRADAREAWERAHAAGHTPGAEAARALWAGEGVCG